MILQFGFGPALALALVHSLWQVALLAVLAACSLGLLRRHSAGLRHAVGMVWMVTMLVAPLATLLSYRATPTTVELVTAGDEMPSMGAALELLGLTAPAGWTGDALWMQLSHLWLAGTMAMLVLRFGGAWRLLRRMENEPCRPLPPDWQLCFDQLRCALEIERAVLVRLAEHVVAPFTARMVRPVIWLSGALLTQLPIAQVKALLAHELAHIRRLDWLWNGFQCVIESLLFYHPGMWWLSRRIREDREQACDDLAVATCGDGLALAEALAALHRQRSASSRLVLSSHGGSILKRISHLVSAPPLRADWRVPALLVLLLSSGSLLAMQSDTPVRPVTAAVADAPWQPGSVREANVVDGESNRLVYRVGMDAQGRMYEVFKENGRTKPISEQVRARLRALDVALVLPAGTTLQGPASPKSPPSPASPQEPDQTASAEFKEIVEQIVADGRVAAMLGQPYGLEPGSFKGSIKSWGLPLVGKLGLSKQPEGTADVTVLFAGPRGRARVHYQGVMAGGRWKSSLLDIAMLEAQ